MAKEAGVILGSGINPLKKDVVRNMRGDAVLRGTATVLLNPEDGSAGRSGLVSAATVETTAIKLPTEPLPHRRAIAIFNTSSSETLYIGFDSSVTTSTGWPVPANTSLPMDFNAEIELYGISGSSIDVRIMEVA